MEKYERENDIALIETEELLNNKIPLKHGGL
jgi:hypothetical protein